MELIIDGMLKRGAEKVNSRFVLEFLKNEGITPGAADLGGNEGRVIHFHSHDLSVYQRKIKKTVMQDLVLREKRFWEQEATRKHP
jgi:chemotaxis protein CheD